MNSRRFGLVLMAANLGLLGTLAYMVFTMRLGTPVAAPSGKPSIVTNTITQVTVRKVNPTNFLEAFAGRIRNWQMLESTNYVVYIDNLRHFGCPEETIRDIIITDVAKVYSRRRAELRAQAPPQPFWKTVDALNAESAGLQAQLRALDQEQRELIRELLGVDLRAEMTKYWNEEDYQNFGDDFVPAEKREQLRALLQKHDDLEQELYARSRGVFLDEDEAVLRKLKRDREAELAALLTPEELEEYQLRHSDTANTMRTQLAGFEPSEDEFRKIFRLQKEFESGFADAFDPRDDASMDTQSRAQAQAALEEELKKVLGADRFAQYERAQDNDYKTLVQISERYEMPRDVADRIYSMKVQANQQRQQIEANVTLSDEQRAAALTAIARETERSVSLAMGEKVFKSYQKAGGQWIGDLYAVPEPVPEPELVPVPTPVLPPLPPDVLRSLIFNATPPAPPPPQR